MGMNRWLSVLMLLTACGGSDRPLAVVDDLDLDRYAGTWHEIARLPNRFERDLKCVTATYTLRENGSIGVRNRGVSTKDPDVVKDIEGSARVPDPAEPARLKVTFFWPFAGDYQVLALDPSPGGAPYRYALVGAPDREYLWVLAREPELEQSVYDSLVALAGERGFPVAELERIPQDCPPAP